MTGRKLFIASHKRPIHLVLSLCIICLSGPSLAASDAPLGRLFSLPSERLQLNKLRLDSQQSATPKPKNSSPTTAQTKQVKVSKGTADDAMDAGAAEEAEEESNEDESDDKENDDEKNGDEDE